MKALDRLRETWRRDRVFEFMIQGQHSVQQGKLDIAKEMILYLEGVSVSFDGFKAINDLNLYIRDGELRCIIGPNGAGKTTMMDIITGKTRPDEGSVYFGQTLDVTKMSEYEIASAGIGRKFQKPTIFPEHTVFENLELAMEADKRVWPSLFARLSADQIDKIFQTLKTIMLEDQKELQAKHLSHGQKQWLEIGMLLMQNPRLLLVDEPIAGMTHQEAEKTAELLTGLAGEHSVVVVEHDMEFVRSIAKTVTVLHEGHVLAEGTMDEIQSDPKVIEVYLGE